MKRNKTRSRSNTPQRSSGEAAVTRSRKPKTRVRRAPTIDDNSESFSKRRSWKELLLAVFCPRAFHKGRLAEGYARFQAFDTLQALCSYLRGVLCTQALLKGLGVGSSDATASAAALTFITKDGAGMLGSLWLAWGYSDSFGRHVKAWRLFADVTNDVALAIDLYAPKFAPSNTFVALICLSSILKAWCGVSAGATRAAITSHFALSSEDVADIAAKEGSQETAVTLMGMILGYTFLTYATDPAEVQTNLVWGLFWFLTAVHVYANYQAVRSLHFRSFDWWRLDLILQDTSSPTFRSISEQESLVSLKQPLPFPKFGKASSRVPTRNLTENVYLASDKLASGDIQYHLIVANSASSKDVITACIAARLLQSRRIPVSRLDDELLSEASGLVELIAELGWDLEASRSLLGDIQELRV